jgi:hypothetical protein
VTPLSVDVWGRPLNFTATSLVPSADDATELQDATDARATQVTPLSVEV